MVLAQQSAITLSFIGADGSTVRQMTATLGEDFIEPRLTASDSVAEGRVLILSPWEYDADKRHISRADCVALNGMAEEIASSLSSITPDTIRQNGQ